jgi:hypothetical protein
MKIRKFALVSILAMVVAQVFAAGKAEADTLTGSDIQNLLVNQSVYACGTGANGETWDEKLSGGNITDYKQGPTDLEDPTSVEGTYSIDFMANTITYTYGSDSFTYSVSVSGSVNPGTLPRTYTFTGPQTLAITVSATPCQPHRT